MPDSLTKVPVTAAELTAMVREGFGGYATVAESAELTDGTYNLALRVRLAGGPDLVLKVAPPPGMKLLRHEKDLMRTEVDFYRLAGAAGAPVPGVLHADLSRNLIGRDYVFLRRLAGISLAKAGGRLDLAATGALRAELGRAVARVHTVTGERFGYPLRDSGTWQPTWRAAFLAMLDDLLADASRLGTELPGAPAAIAARLGRHADALDAVTRPALVHFDLWDGNVFVRQFPDGWRLAGLIDGERAFYGDPYAEFVSLALFRDIRQLPELLDGYAEATGAPVEFTEQVRVRLALYTCYLYLVILTEGPTRGFAGPGYERTRRETWQRLAGQLATL